MPTITRKLITDALVGFAEASLHLSHVWEGLTASPAQSGPDDPQAIWRDLNAAYPDGWEDFGEMARAAAGFLSDFREPQRTTRTDGPRLYVDVHIADTENRNTTFGPFSTHAAAEKALIEFIRRENALHATIRDPEA